MEFESPFDEVNDSTRKLGQGPLVGVSSKWVAQHPESREQLDVRGDVIAFNLTHGGEESAWGTYYGPMSSGITKEGASVEFPSQESITSDVLGTWAARVEAAKHPLLRHRFADLIWDLTPAVTGRPAPAEFARVAIDAAVEAVKDDVFQIDIEGYFVAERAISICKSIRDRPRQRVAEDALVDYERRHAEDRFTGTWVHAFDELVLESSLISEDQRKQLVVTMEARLERLSTPSETTHDPFGAQAAAERLMSLFRKQRDRENEKRILLRLRDAFLAFCANAPAMLSDAWVNRVHALLASNGLSLEARELEPLLRQYGKAAAQELKPREMSFTIPAGQVEALYAHLTKGTIETSIATLAGAFIASKQEMASQMEALLTEAPLMARIGVQLTDQDGRRLAALGSVESDPDGRLVHQVAQHMTIEAPLLRAMLARLEARAGLSAEVMIGLLKGSPLVEESRSPLVVEGLRLLFAEQHVAAAHILLPQIEHCIRLLVARIGGSTMKTNRFGGLDYATLDQLISRAVSVFGEDRSHYLRVLLTDPRGWNLRNDALHGLLPAQAFGQASSDRLLHVFMMLAQIRSADHVASAEPTMPAPAPAAAKG